GGALGQRGRHEPRRHRLRLPPEGAGRVPSALPLRHGSRRRDQAREAGAGRPSAGGPPRGVRRGLQAGRDPGRGPDRARARRGDRGGDLVTNGTAPTIRGGAGGAGHMGQYHILALAEIWGVELVGVVDTDFRRAERVAAPYGAREYRDHRWLAGQIDFATVAVPTEQHFTVARVLLEAGAHVLVEKP